MLATSFAAFIVLRVVLEHQLMQLGNRLAATGRGAQLGGLKLAGVVQCSSGPGFPSLLHGACVFDAWKCATQPSPH